MTSAKDIIAKAKEIAKWDHSEDSLDERNFRAALNPEIVLANETSVDPYDNKVRLGGKVTRGWDAEQTIDAFNHEFRHGAQNAGLEQHQKPNPYMVDIGGNAVSLKEIDAIAEQKEPTKTKYYPNISQKQKNRYGKWWGEEPKPIPEEPKSQPTSIPPQRTDRRHSRAELKSNTYITSDTMVSSQDIINKVKEVSDRLNDNKETGVDKFGRINSFKDANPELVQSNIGPKMVTRSVGRTIDQEAEDSQTAHVVNDSMYGILSDDEKAKPIQRNKGVFQEATPRYKRREEKYQNKVDNNLIAPNLDRVDLDVARDELRDDSRIAYELSERYKSPWGIKTSENHASEDMGLNDTYKGILEDATSLETENPRAYQMVMSDPSVKRYHDEMVGDVSAHNKEQDDFARQNANLKLKSRTPTAKAVISKSIELMKRMGYDGSPQDAVSRSSQEMNRKLGEPMAEDIDAKVAYETKRINPQLQVPEAQSSPTEKRKEWASTFQNFEPSIASAKEKLAQQKHEGRAIHHIMNDSIAQSRADTQDLMRRFKNGELTPGSEEWHDAYDTANRQGNDWDDQDAGIDDAFTEHDPSVYKGASADNAKHGELNKPKPGAKEHIYKPFSVAPKSSDVKTKVFPKGTKTEDLVEKSEDYMEIGDSYREPRLPSKPKRDNINSNERFTGTKEEREAERKFIKEEKEMAAKPDDILQDRATEKKNKKDRQQRSADKKVPNVKVLKSSDIIDISQEIMKRLNLSGAPAPIRDAWDEVSAVSEEENKRKKEWAARDAQKKKSEQMTLEGKPLFARKTEAETLFDKEQKRGYDKHQSDRAQAGKDALFPRYKKDEEGVPIDPDSLYDTDVGDKDIETFKASASDIIEYTGYIDNIMNKIDVATSSYDVQPAPKITPRPIDSRKGQKSKKKYYDPGIDTYDKSKMWSEPINPAKVPTSHAELIPQMPRNTTSEVSGNTASISYRPIKPKMTVSPELESERASEQMRRDIHNRGIEAKRKRKQAEQDKFDAENPPQGDAGHMYQL